MIAKLKVVRGPDTDRIFSIEKGKEYQVGRGSDCQITISDPLASRVHATISFQDGRWYLRDCGSRNGTQMDGQTVHEATLVDGSRVRIGNTEFRFIHPDEEATVDISQPNQVLIQDADMTGMGSSVSALGALQDQQRRQDLLDLFQLSYRLLGMECVRGISELALDVLTARTKASVVGLLWTESSGQLRPQTILPADKANAIRLNTKLTDLVCREGKAIWLKSENHETNGQMKQVADAICAPLLEEGKTVGAIHVYRENAKFDEADFDFVISLSGILGSALLRAQRMAQLQLSRDRLVEKNAEFSELLGESAPMRALKDRIARVAKAGGSVLVRGESGSGKELVARAIHRASTRSHRPLLCVNCAAIPAELIESHLFGHKKGAFTGADKDHVGWFQQADNGTLFLDEIGELTLEGQAKLLRVLENHPFLPVGSNREVRVDVRVIAATNRDLKELVRAKKFREDLFYRLSVFELWIPPLRERGSDIEMLVDSFVEHFKRLRGRIKLSLSDAARKKLLTYSWPGNVRQLRNVIDSAVVMAADDTIQPQDLGLHDVEEETLDTLKIDIWEKRLIEEALKRTQGNIPQASDLLGISRATLYRKLETHGIARD
ncbi:MAG: sigma 54-interacting transcriptional regulator [Pirellulales bacterium]